jgi:hypothetical protein
VPHDRHLLAGVYVVQRGHDAGQCRVYA